MAEPAALADPRVREVDTRHGDKHAVNLTRSVGSARPALVTDASEEPAGLDLPGLLDTWPPEPTRLHLPRCPFREHGVPLLQRDSVVDLDDVRIGHGSQDEAGTRLPEQSSRVPHGAVGLGRSVHAHQHGHHTGRVSALGGAALELGGDPPTAFDRDGDEQWPRRGSQEVSRASPVPAPAEEQQRRAEPDQQPRAQLTLARVPHRSVRFRDDEEGAAEVRARHPKGYELSPTVVVGDEHLTNPSVRRVREAARR